MANQWVLEPPPKWDASKGCPKATAFFHTTTNWATHEKRRGERARCVTHAAATVLLTRRLAVPQITMRQCRTPTPGSSAQLAPSSPCQHRRRGRVARSSARGSPIEAQQPRQLPLRQVSRWPPNRRQRRQPRRMPRRATSRSRRSRLTCRRQPSGCRRRRRRSSRRARSPITRWRCCTARACATCPLCCSAHPCCCCCCCRARSPIRPIRVVRKPSD